MKNLLFVCGPNGIGKTTICKEIIKQIPNSAYVDSDPCRMMNPFILDDITIPTISKNISDLIANYFNCSSVNTVIFSYGFHGRRKEVFKNILLQIADIDLKLSRNVQSKNTPKSRQHIFRFSESERLSTAGGGLPLTGCRKNATMPNFDGK